nr:MAG TPA: hypothetical protein [Caudoviricetes sp.]
MLIETTKLLSLVVNRKLPVTFPLLFFKETFLLAASEPKV